MFQVYDRRVIIVQMSFGLNPINQHNYVIGLLTFIKQDPSERGIER